MRVVIQRVTSAEVNVDGKKIASIHHGLLIFLGISPEDGMEDIQWLTKKIANVRVFNDENGLMNLSILEVKGSVLVVSQFTLMAQTKKGNRPSYIKAARPEQAEPLYQKFIHQLEHQVGRSISTGCFGADMSVSLTNDGPVTLILDSKQKL